MAAIEVTDLFKSYGPVDAVRGISFRVEDGEVFALLGPNGAGKTTTLEILEGHRRRSGGQVSVLGADPQLGGSSFRDRIGIVTAIRRRRWGADCAGGAVDVCALLLALPAGG